MTVRFVIVMVIVSGFIRTSGQTISRAEYFFDTDPGLGNGTTLAVPFPSDNVVFTPAISTSGLDPGYHVLFIRTRSSDGLWSLYEHQQFIIEVPIEEAEYFFDVDPGFGNGHALTLAGGQLTIAPAIPTTGLDDGDHVLFIRTRQAGKWSLSDPVAFYIQTRIVEAEYFIDIDPGFGNGTPVIISSPSDQVTINANIEVGLLDPGDHYLFIRTRDILGKWSFYEPQMFTVEMALPVELTNLRAVLNEDQNVMIAWVTLTETMSDFFSIEHSADGIGFSEFAQVPAAGDSRLPRQYSALHQHPVIGNNYYRLKMVDLDGRVAYSSVVAARIYNAQDPLVYPNPVLDYWVIDFSQTENATVRVIDLFDVNGKKSLSMTATASEKTIFMKRHGLNNGIYTLRISSAKGVKVLKVHFR
jgi:hypothetical protein